MTDKPKDKSKGAKSNAADRDDIDKLSLSIIPLTSTTLKNARLIKNSRMETAVELHNDPISGSLQIQPEDISDAFAGSEKDQEIIMALANLSSYDVYSMRKSLKKLNITVGVEVLSLSQGMKDALAKYTIEFTRPLIEKIFGAGRIVVDDANSLQHILRDSDAAKVRENLQIMTARTGIPLDEIPAFLEAYSDVFLSVAYYRYSFENIGPDITRFLKWVHELRGHRDITASPQTSASCRRTEESVRFIANSLTERLKKFNTGFEMFWSDINKKSFDALRHQIENNHMSMGAILCGLIVKMRNWSSEFQDNTMGGPQTRAKFIISEMEPGLEKLKALENEARKQIGLPPMHI